MKKQVFVTSTEEDKRYRNKVMKWGTTNKLGPKVSVMSIDEPRFLHPDGSPNRQILSWALKESSLVVILVGDKNHNHPWLDWEGEFCHQWGIKRVVMRIPYTEGRLPEEFRLLREIAYNPNAIEKEIRPQESSNLYY